MRMFISSASHFSLGALTLAAAILLPNVGAAQTLAPKVAGEPVAIDESALAKQGRDMRWRGTPTARPPSVGVRRVDPARIDAMRDANRKPAGPRKSGFQIGVEQLVAEEGLGPSRVPLNFAPVAVGGRSAFFDVTTVDASSVRVALRVAHLPPDAELRFAGSDDPNNIVHALRMTDLPMQLDEQQRYWTPMTEGKSQRIEVYLPGVSTPGAAAPVVDVIAVSHIVGTLKDNFIGAIQPKGFSGPCNVDAVCPTATPGYTNLRRSVARMIYQKNGGTSTCTGTLLNDNDASTQIPYFYGANHCVDTQSVANTVTTYWFYDNLTCGGSDLPLSQSTALFGGATLLYADQSSDVLLLRLNSPPPQGAFFSGWDANLVATNTAMTVMHHPQGDPKKVSLASMIRSGTGYEARFPGAFLELGYTSGTTEQGSSGAGAFTVDGSGAFSLRGGLWGGGASCLNAANINDPNNRDGYSRFDAAFPILRKWLFDAAPTAPATNYTDLWWAGLAENGWGLSIVQHSPSNIQFNALYIYDTQGNPLWVVMPGGTWSNGFSTFSGQVYIPSGSFWQNYNTANFAARPPVGTVTINFTGNDTATLAYTINGLSGNKTISRQDIRGGTAPFNVADMWYGGPAQDGWGVSILQQTGTPFAVWYTYGNTCTGANTGCSPTWFVMPGGGAWSGNVYTAPLYSTRSSAWLGANYNPSQLLVTTVGTLSFNFTNANAGTMTYTVNGVSQSKAIQRQVF